MTLYTTLGGDLWNPMSRRRSIKGWFGTGSDWDDGPTQEQENGGENYGG